MAERCSQDVFMIVFFPSQPPPPPPFFLVTTPPPLCEFPLSVQGSAREVPYMLRPLFLKSHQICPRNSSDGCVAERILFPTSESGMAVTLPLSAGLETGHSVPQTQLVETLCVCVGRGVGGGGWGGGTATGGQATHLIATNLAVCWTRCPA